MSIEMADGPAPPNEEARIREMARLRREIVTKQDYIETNKSRWRKDVLNSEKIKLEGLEKELRSVSGDNDEG